MQQKQIEQLRIDIKSDYESQISKLKKDMEMELSALDRLENRLKKFSLEEGSDIGQERPSRLIRRSIKTAFDDSSSNQSIKQMLIGTLNKIEGEFKRVTLLNVTGENEGTTIKPGSFSPAFAGLVKDGIIEVVKEGKGSSPGLYKKGDLNKLIKTKQQE